MAKVGGDALHHAMPRRSSSAREMRQLAIGALYRTTRTVLGSAKILNTHGTGEIRRARQAQSPTRFRTTPAAALFAQFDMVQDSVELPLTGPV